MPRVILQNSNVRVVIQPDLGGGIAACDVMIGRTWEPVMRRANETTEWFNDLACYILAPWSNRIRAGTFHWEEIPRTLKTDWGDGTAIHGDVKAAKFVVLDRSPQSVRLTTDRSGATGRNWPWEYECTVRYQLEGLRLTMSVSVKNRSATTMPCGLGLHPFFMTRVGNSAAVVQTNISGRYPCEGMMPVAQARNDELCRSLQTGWKVQGGLDDVFTLGSAEFESLVTWPGVLKMKLTAQGGCGHAVIYSGEAGHEPTFFCLEPVTHVNDGLNLLTSGWRNTGVRPLRPGEKMKLDTEFEFERI